MIERRIVEVKRVDGLRGVAMGDTFRGRTGVWQVMVAEARDAR